MGSPSRGVILPLAEQSEKRLFNCQDGNFRWLARGKRQPSRARGCLYIHHRRSSRRQSERPGHISLSGPGVCSGGGSSRSFATMQFGCNTPASLVSAPQLAARTWRSVTGATLDLALAAHMILELKAGCLERVVQGNVDVLAVFAVHHDFRPRQRDIEPHCKLRALPLRPVQNLGDHMAGLDTIALPTQLVRLFSYIGFQRAGIRYASQNDLYGIMHGSRPLAARNNSVVIVVIQRQASAAVALDDALAIDLVMALVGHLRGLLPGVGPAGRSAPLPAWRLGGGFVRRAADFALLGLGTHSILPLRLGVQRNDNCRGPVDIGQKNLTCLSTPTEAPRIAVALGACFCVRPSDTASMGRARERAFDFGHSGSIDRA